MTNYTIHYLIIRVHQYDVEENRKDNLDYVEIENEIESVVLETISQREINEKYS